ncbi:hypothetical protein [Streptomyces cucumeris]|uniref:hypothetical protein n=1 Tax=Streptomyces cucumeris TaxID=2962890 RepID=UPI003D70D014
MGRYTAVPTLLILLLTAACSGANDANGGSPASTTRPSSAKPGDGSAVEPKGSSRRTSLDLPSGAKILMPVTKGTGDADLPAFKPATDVYTIHAKCAGKGKMTLVDRKVPGGKPTKIGCNGPITIGRVYTDITTQALSVQVHGGNLHWSIAIVSGEHSM